MKSILRIISAVVLLLLAILMVSAQAVPLIDVVFDRETASQGDVVEASIFIRDGTNIAGVDIGVETNECLSIVDRPYGSYLPDPSSGSSFAPFDQQTETDTRLAVAITDRTQIANGDGIFYSLMLNVICETGIGEVNVTFAELSAYVDPEAEAIELTAYRTDSNLMTQNGSIIIGEDAEDIVQATADAQTVDDTVDDDGQEVDDTTDDTGTMFDSLTIVVMSVICCLILLLLLLILYLVRRLMKNRQDKK